MRQGLVCAVAVSSLVGCAPGLPAPSDELNADATIPVSVSVEYRQPSAGRPISIGGYAYFGEVLDVEGPVVDELELTPPVSAFELASGAYRLDVAVRPQSDAILVDDEGVHRSFGPVSARCTLNFTVTDAELRLQFTAVGGDRCELTVRGA